MKNIFNCFGKTKSNKNSTILDKPMASQPALKSECVLCRRRLHQFVCPTCSKPEVGIRNFNDPARRPLGQRGAALITHTMHIKGLVTAQHISTFLSNLKILKSKGIFWTDAFQVNRVTSEVKRKGFEGICEVKSIESLMDDYLKNKNTYINEPRKRKILNHIIFENKSNSGKPSFATDYLRVIALYLFGGLYIDTTIHFLPSNTIQNELTYLKRVDYSGVKFNFDTYSSITDHDVSKSLKKAIYLSHP